MNPHNTAVTGPLISRSLAQGVRATTFRVGTRTEHHLTAALGARSDLRAICEVIGAFLEDNDAQLVAMDVFGLSALEIAPILKGYWGHIACPITWIEEGSDLADAVGGIELWAVSQITVEVLELGGKRLGMVFEDECARYCRLGGLIGDTLDSSRPEQARSVMNQMIQGLGAAGMTFANVIRTWYYNDHILDWYPEFNAVRTTFFKEHHVFDGLVPASTGIGGRNAAGSALTAGLLAVAPKENAVKTFAVASPLQCPALDYGSSFSRAVELDEPGVRRVLISGTASIAPEGHTLHEGDVDAQTQLTMQVVHAILESRGMNWSHITRAIAYIKHHRDRMCFARYAATAKLPVFPFFTTINDVCRDDLLFEIEVDAVVAK